MTDARDVIAARAARELRSGEVVNLGIGIPNRIPGFLDPAVELFLHTENGLLGVGPRPADGEVDRELIDAGKRPITLARGAAAFDSAASFAMIRGGHIDAVVLGALEVSEAGDIANWKIPGGKALGVGGAMDLVTGARRVIVTMTATTPEGAPKLVPACTLPLTAAGVVSTVITEHAVFRCEDDGLVLTELLDGATEADVAAETSARYRVALG
ncbi:MAG: 3-oxoacid CoA-transferase subunit B [Gaiellales bacterium]